MYHSTAAPSSELVCLRTFCRFLRVKEVPALQFFFLLSVRMISPAGAAAGVSHGVFSLPFALNGMDLAYCRQLSMLMRNFMNFCASQESDTFCWVVTFVLWDHVGPIKPLCESSNKDKT